MVPVAKEVDPDHGLSHRSPDRLAQCLFLVTILSFTAQVVLAPSAILTNLISLEIRVPCWVVLCGYTSLPVCCVAYVTRAWRIMVFYKLQSIAQDDSLKLGPATASLTPSEIGPQGDDTQLDSHTDLKSGHKKIAYTQQQRFYKHCTDRNLLRMAFIVSFVLVVGTWAPFVAFGRFDGIFYRDSACPELAISFYTAFASFGAFQSVIDFLLRC